MESVQPPKLETLIEKLTEQVAELVTTIQKSKGETDPQQKVLVSEAVEKWLSYCKRFTDRTQETYLFTIKKFVKGLPKYVRYANDIEVAHLQSYIGHLLSAGLKRATANRRLTTIRSFCRWLSETYDIENVASKIRNLKEDPPTVRLLSEQEYEKVLTVATGNVKNLIEFLGNTGLRVSECCDLTWSSVDWENKRLVIVGKGRKRRAITLNSKTLQILNELRRPGLNGYIFNISFISKARKEFFVQRPDIRGIFLAKTKKGRAQQLANLRYSRTHKKAVKNTGRADRRRLGRICFDVAKATSIEKFGPHALRRYFATTLFAKGMDVSRISKLLGHSSIKTTEKIYVHFRDSFLDGSTECLVDTKGGI